MFLKQSTAYTFRHGPFLDDTDGKTAETGLTISQADVRLSKAGGDFAQKNESSASSHDEIGYYIVAIDATDTNTCGELLVAVHESGALPVFKTFQVLEETIYDSLFATSAAAFDANQRVDVAKIEGSDATDQINAACDTALADIHLDHLLAADYDPASKPGTATALFNELIESDGGVSRFTVNALEQGPSGSGGDATEAKQDQIIAAVITNAAGTDVAADIIAIKAETATIVADTNELQTDDVPGLISALNNISTADVNAQCDLSLADYDAPTKAEMDSAFSTTDAKIDAVDDYIDTEIAAIKTVTDAIPDSGTMSSIATASALTTVSGKIDTIDTVVDANAGKLDTLVADSPGRPAKGVALAGFPFLLVASSDHVTGKTGATVTATRSLDGAAFAACANTATEVGSGIYKIDLASSDLDADTVVLKFTATDADTRYVTIVTQST